VTTPTLTLALPTIQALLQPSNIGAGTSPLVASSMAVSMAMPAVREVGESSHGGGGRSDVATSNMIVPLALPSGPSNQGEGRLHSDLAEKHPKEPHPTAVLTFYDKMMNSSDKDLKK
jgi:hypothetical protein